MNRIILTLCITTAAVTAGCLTDAIEENQVSAAGGQALTLRRELALPRVRTPISVSPAQLPQEVSGEVDESGGVIIIPGDQDCASYAYRPMVDSSDGPDGGTCTLTVLVGPCSPSSGVCICDILAMSEDGDCEDDGSIDTLTGNTAETEGIGW